LFFVKDLPDIDLTILLYHRGFYGRLEGKDDSLWTIYIYIFFSFGVHLVLSFGVSFIWNAQSSIPYAIDSEYSIYLLDKKNVSDSLRNHLT
jgi:hypothetical protein